VPLSPVGAATFSGERWAVVIGVSDYDDERLKLRFADRDAEAFKEFLTTPRGGRFASDHLRFLPNRKATAENIRDALGTFLGAVQPEDYVVIFLAGHGLPDPRDAEDFYFLPYDADLDRLPSTAISMWEVRRWVEKIKAERVLLIADACHSGAMGSKGVARGLNAINRYLQKLGESYETVVTLTSSSGYQLSQEDKKWGSGHGVFTYHLLRALREDATQADKNKDGIVDAEEAFLYVVPRVIQETKGNQLPDRSGDLGSGIPLAVVSPEKSPASGASVKRSAPEPSATKAPPARLHALLRECATHLKANRLTTGQGGNAVDCYLEVLKLDRGNAEALAGLDRVVDQYAEWAEHALSRKQFTRAKTYLDRMASVNPEHPRLVALRDQWAGRDTTAITSVERPQPAGNAQSATAAVPEMVVIPAGAFWMGSDKARDSEAYGSEFPRHRVTIDRPFAIGKYEVTFDDYEQFARATGRALPDDEHWGRDHRPVIKVSWEDATAYTEWLSQQTGKRYRLPTEAQWEYAARAGTETRYWWGDDIGRHRANCRGCGSQWDNKQTAPVGSFEANPFGLHDTAGNVWEWVQDCWHDNYEGAPTDGSAWETDDCRFRVFRGGSWYSPANDNPYLVIETKWLPVGYNLHNHITN
ncbi:MAG: SUMF1/EgtB/PvdO family nonheme iron enzyme, partial [Gammaproteobacteria bacterium]